MSLQICCYLVHIFSLLGALSVSLPNRWSPYITQRQTELKFQDSTPILTFLSYTFQRLSLFSSMAITHILKPTISMSSSSHFTPSIPSPSSPFKTHFFTTIPSRIYSHQTPLPTLSRRLFLPSVSGIWDALTGGANNARESILAIRRGMLLFRQVCNDSCTVTHFCSKKFLTLLIFMYFLVCVIWIALLLLRVMFLGLQQNLTRQLSWILVKRHVGCREFFINASL